MRTPGLATKAALAAALAVCAGLAAFSLAAYALIRERAIDQVDRTLIDTADSVAADLSTVEPGDPDFAEVPAPGSPAIPARSDLVLPPGTRVRIDPEGTTPPAEPRSVTIAGQPYRLTVRELPPAGDGQERTVAVARPLADVERTLDQVAVALAIVGVITALAATALTFALVRQALRPLRTARSAAERIAASEDLSLRVPEGRRDEVGVLAHSMNRMLERLEAAQGRLRRTLEEQRRFAADASHELRTPLTALRGDLDLLAREGIPEEERAAILDEMRTASDGMDRLVRGLLRLARIEGRDTDRPERIVLAEFVADLLDGDEELRVAPGEAETAVVADRDALTAIVGNLLENARRHGTRVAVEVGRTAGRAMIAVQDDGPGVAPADRERIFDRFYRARGERRTPGTGLGLAIARAAASRIEGTVRLADSEEGARFEVLLPAAGERARPSRREKAPGPS
jgi:signal transduction histidine kinase